MDNALSYNHVLHQKENIEMTTTSTYSADTTIMVSIITPLYNGEKFVRQTIDSVLAQTYSNWEMLIVDDGSTDNSAAIVREYTLLDSRIQLFQQQNQGSATARNNAIGHATGRYIAFLDADDLWDSNYLEEQMRFMSQKRAAIACTSCRRIDEHNQEVLRPFIVPEHITYSAMLKSCQLPCLSTIIDRQQLTNIAFNTELHSLRDDYVLWLTLIKQAGCAYGNPKVLTSYRLTTTAATANKWKVIKPQFLVYYRIEKLGIMRSLYYLCCWAYYGLKKYIN